MEQFGLKREVLDFIAETARSNELERVILFGSRATGTFSEKSDIDLAIQGGDMHEFEFQMEEHCPTLLQFDFINLEEDISTELRDRIASEGTAIYG
ncbi:MAG: nucleotidyltransferase domain-containing protein [Eggerthellaceae bacterium]|nr:nucleotidyltransferase domain-containing protein [Eggerthellaceae bacterium]